MPAEAAPLLGDLAARMPVAFATRCTTGPVFTQTYGYAGSEIDLLNRGLVPARHLSGRKSRWRHSLTLCAGTGPCDVASAFAAYQ